MTALVQDEQAVLDTLDWQYDPPCDAKSCKHDAVATAKYEVHDACGWHKGWHAHCQTHLDKGHEGKAVCRRCRQALLLADVLYL